MAALRISHSYLEDLRSEAKALSEGIAALDGLLDREAARLKREDEASTLRAVYRVIVEQLERARSSESCASYRGAKADLMLSLTGLAAKIVVAATTKSQRARNIVRNLFDTEGQEKPFGTLMVCVGAKGLPDDVVVVSISQLARESNRPETEILSKLQDDGYLLFSEQEFSVLIDRLVAEVREGKLHLPVSKNKLSEIAELNKPKLRVRIVKLPASCRG
jgi:hypothetical protein